MREAMPAFFLTLLSRRFRERFFFEAHSFVRHYQFVYRRIFRYARGVVITSDQKAEAFRATFHLPEAQMIVRGNAIDSELF